MKKYELTDEKIELYGMTLYRIKACTDFTTASGYEVKKDELGGFIEKESNLSQAGTAWVGGNAEVYGNARVCGNAEVFKSEHLLVIGAIGSRNDFITFFRDKDNEISVKCGCFLGKISDFLDKVSETHDNNKHAAVYRAAAELAKLQIDLSVGGES